MRAKTKFKTKSKENFEQFDQSLSIIKTVEQAISTLSDFSCNHFDIWEGGSKMAFHGSGTETTQKLASTYSQELRFERI
jgi:hypothetical protein